MSGKDDPLARIERIRNLLALFLVGAFVGALGAFTWWSIPETNKDIITYMVGQLSGMATMALGFYFVNKVGQDALDASKTDNTARAFDAIKAATEQNRTVQIEQPDGKPVPVKEE